MPPVNILIKPASSACNMNCRYCFYDAIARQRDTAFMGMLSDELLERIVEQAFAYAEQYCGFTFQGGEPTLAGLPFYERVVQLQKKHNTKHIRVLNAIQTNGYVIDDEWAAFLAKNAFLVGLSLDGNAQTHNANRIDHAGEPTFNRVMRAANALKKQGADFNILSVVTGQNARNIEKTYHFLKKNGFRYLQFIPCLEPLEITRGSTPYHLSDEGYASFLKRLFDLWYADYLRREYVSIRHIDNLAAIARQGEPEACSMRGHCTLQFVVEGDGSVYPCDFFVYDQFRLGNIQTATLAEMAQSSAARRFLDSSRELPDECGRCEYLYFCRNGCARDRIGNLNYYCAAYRDYFGYLLRTGRMQSLASFR